MCHAGAALLSSSALAPHIARAEPIAPVGQWHHPQHCMSFIASSRIHSGLQLSDTTALIDWSLHTRIAEVTAQPAATPVSLAEQGGATAPPVSNAAGPQQPVAPKVSADQQPGVRSDAAEKLKSEVDALLKQPPPAIPPLGPAASPNAQPGNGSKPSDVSAERITCIFSATTSL